MTLGIHMLLLATFGGAMVLFPNRYTFASFMLIAIVTAWAAHAPGGHHAGITQQCAPDHPSKG